MSTSASPQDPLDRILSGEDATDLVAAFELSTLGGVPAVTGDPWPPTPTFAAEAAYLRLLTRSDPGPPVPRSDPTGVEDVVLQAEAAAGSAAMAAAEPDPTDHTGLLRSATARFTRNQILFYDPAVAWAEPARLKALFDPFADHLRAAIDLDVDDVLSFLEALNRRSVEFVAREARVRVTPGSIAELVAAIRAGVAAGAGADVRRGSGQDLALTPAQLASRSGRSATQVDRFLELFATEAPCAECAAPFGTAVWVLRRRPVLRWQDRLIAPIAGKLLVAIRPALETVLRQLGTKLEQQYIAHKGKWLEQRTTRLLDELLEPDQLFRKLEYPLEDGQSTERDVLVRVDLMALAVEAKAGGITPRARAGGVASQQTVLDRLVHEAIGQAQDLIRALGQVAVTGIERDDKRVAVDIGNVTRFAPVAVTLEDVGGVTARSQALFDSTTDADERPLVVNVDDLEWYGRALGTPARLLHYLVVRQRIAEASMAVYDEADWFRLYLQSGGAGVQEWIDMLAELPTQVIGHAGDARRGMPDPRLVERPAPFLEVSERWRAEGRDGWLEASFAIFDLSVGQVDALPRALAEAGRRARSNDAIAIATFRPAGDPTGALHVAVPPDGSGRVDLQQLAPTFKAQAPDAARHIITGSRKGVVDDLILGGMALIDPAPEEPDE